VRATAAAAAGRDEALRPILAELSSLSANAGSACDAAYPDGPTGALIRIGASSC
jgi:hypothetical protein